MNFFWQILLRAALGALAGLVQSYVSNLQAARLDDPSLITAVDRAVRNAETQKDLSGPAKMDHALSILKAWARELGREMSESLARTSIELGVQRLDD